MRDASAPTHTLSTFELVAMVAALTALNAVSIDIMLTALPHIGADFAIVNENDRQLVVVIYLGTFGVAQLFYGPLTDALGRRPVLVWALGIYALGALTCVLAGKFTVFLLGRALQGVGAAATRVISTAVVRDLTDGRRMAQIMSMAMTAFMIVPVVAPGIGQLIMFVAPWRWIFGALLAYAAIILAWATMRLPETLPPEKRQKLQLGAAMALYARVASNRQTLGYTLAATFAAAGLVSYVSSSQQIFVEVFGLGAAFPLAFASVAIAMSIGNVINSRIVMRFGMRRIGHAVAVWLTGVALLNAAIFSLGLGSFWIFISLFAVTLGVFGIVNSNFNALALQPAAYGAGSASALYGGVTTIGGSIIGGLIAHAYDGTVLPFLIGMVALGLAIIATAAWTERGKLFQEGAPLIG